MNLLLLIYLLYVAVRVRVTQACHLFIVPYLDNECLTSYLRLSNLIYDTRSTWSCQERPEASELFAWYIIYIALRDFLVDN